ncbi:non-specific lipid transfer protein GPI-anchored 11-like [Zingiber officinale]|uniref:non-specific lipid transfer protein GPI-anchored 11-like n=1 Tax=Zingiber officinale TaxID=94328 RepID=UPI001C4D8275|nr:non-specific lipid transfer protein GPI-anchored 11-like [Zingiber officinale]
MNRIAAALAVGLMVAACVVAAEDCSNVLTDLLDCLSYVSNGSKTSSPSAGCCIGVADVVIGSPSCICDALKQARELGVELNTSRVLALPAACDVKAPEMRCGGGSSLPCSALL